MRAACRAPAGGRSIGAGNLGAPFARPAPARRLPGGAPRLRGDGQQPSLAARFKTATAPDTNQSMDSSDEASTSAAAAAAARDFGCARRALLLAAPLAAPLPPPPHPPKVAGSGPSLSPARCVSNLTPSSLPPLHPS
jgi:hypothetical protein